MDGDLAPSKDAGLGKNCRALIHSPLSSEGENTFICEPLRSDLEQTTTSTRINEPPTFCSGSDDTCREDDTTVAKSLDSQIPHDTSLCHHEDSHQDQNMTRQGDGFEIARDVLMTLGAGDHEAYTSAHVGPNTGDSEGGNLLSPLLNLKSIGNIGPAGHRVALQLSTGRSVELLRHYRYKIAPWVRQTSLLVYAGGRRLTCEIKLDMCDMKQTFGLVVPHLAMRSDLSFDALLELCSASYNIHHDHTDSSNSPMETRTCDLTHTIQNSIEHSQPWEVNLWSILAATKNFLADPPESWEDTLSKNNILHEAFLERSSSNDLNACMVWLLARLGKRSD